ncbi:glycoside hydrolase family 16 protein [Spirillospora sp. NPDC047279]|uniref:glycoside hydrolase family 16 protein n=1 Tax=Spirillospora sp. NPDC047279 TaxID=3155478 RepID=UPI0033E1EB6F
MLRSRLLTLATAALAVTALTTPAHADPTGTGWTLAFSDDFDGAAGSPPSAARWNFRTDVKALSAQLARNVTLSGDGRLRIHLKKEDVSGKQFTGGGVVSKQALRYGYYETRARLNDGPGWHTAFWLMAGNGSTTFNPEHRTEIDVLETDSAGPTTTQHNVHTWKDATTKTPVHYGTGVYDTGADLRQWHTFGVDWRETSVRYYIDGVLRFTAPYKPSEWTHDYLNIWLTSIAYGVTPDPAKLPATVEFDYIRYWQRDYYVDNDGPAAYGYGESGTWQTSALTGWTHGSPVRYACTAGATATYRPNIRSAGSYDAYVYNPSGSGGDPRARATLNGTTTTIDQSTGTPGWVPLGTHTLPAGTSTTVTLTASGSSCARADAVKFIRR